MPRVPPLDRPATYADLVRLPDGVVGEILDGELHANPRPSPQVVARAIALGGMLLRALDREGPERWQILPEPELHLGADIMVPALAGWRLSRLPELPSTGYFTVTPDWICEIASVGTASFRARKIGAYAGKCVSHAWLLDPVARTVEARRLENGTRTSVATGVGRDTVNLEPFEAIDLPLARLWGGS